MFTIVQLTALDETGDSYYRMRWPAAELAKQSPSWRVINLDARSKYRAQYALECDLLVAYQSADPDLYPIIRERKARGKKTLVEYNDNFYEPPPASPVVKDWSSPLLWQQYEKFMELADGIIVTGPGLHQLFSARFPAKEIFILENHLPHPPEPLENLLRGRATGIAVGWAGSLGHMSDLLATLPIIERVVLKFPNATLHLMGNESIPQFVRIPKERVSFTKWGSIHDYYRFLKKIDIGVIPFLDTGYNRCRSDVKAIELAAHGALPIVPDSIPYQEFIKRTGVPSYKTINDLEALLTKVVSDPKLVTKQLLPCYQYVCEKRVASGCKKRLELYQRFLPKTAGTFAWPVAVGYQEITGELNTDTHVAMVLKEAQTLLQQKKGGQALAILEQAAAKNPDAADLTLSLLRLKHLSRDQTVAKSCAEARKNFAGDLRFLLLQISSTGERAEQLKLWQDLVLTLESASNEYRKFFLRDILNVLLPRLGVDGELGPIGEELSKVYPDSVELSFALSELFEKLGMYKQAYHYSCELLRIYSYREQNEKFLKSIDEKYVRTWNEALKVRAELK